MLNNHSKGILFCLSAAVLWSFSGIGVKLLPNLDSITISGMRSLFACLPLAILAIASKQQVIEHLKVKAVWIAAIAYTGMIFTFILATQKTTAANAILLQYTAPIHVMVMSGLLLKEKVYKKDIIAAIFVLIGVLIFFVNDLSLSGMAGNGIALLSGVLCGGSFLAQRFLGKESKQNQNYSLTSILLGNVFVVLLSTSKVTSLESWEFSNLVVLIPLGIFQLGLAFCFFSKGIPWISAIEAVIVSILEALLNPILVLLFIGEKPETTTIIGGSVILTTIAIYSFTNSRVRKESQTACE